MLSNCVAFRPSVVVMLQPGFLSNILHRKFVTKLVFPINYGPEHGTQCCGVWRGVERCGVLVCAGGCVVSD